MTLALWLERDKMKNRYMTDGAFGLMVAIYLACFVIVYLIVLGA